MNRIGFDDATGGLPLFGDTTGGLPLFARSVRIQALCEKIEELEKDMDAQGFQTPADVLGGIVKPLFTQLGWEFADPRMVVPEFETGSGKVDVGFCHPPGNPRVLVRIESTPGNDRLRDDHPFNDCTHKAIQLAISKDGREWAFHFPAGPGSTRNREFARFDIVQDPEQQVADELEKYLAFHEVESGEAFRQAEQLYRDRCFPAEAVAAWGRALLGSELLERFLEELRNATGVSADRDRARRFIRGQVDGMEWSADPPDPKPARRVAPGDTVWVYDFTSREIVVRVVVDSDPDWEKGEVSRDSPVGVALLGAQEGEEREVRLPDRESRRARIVLIRSRARTG